jgi:uncharacterized membrane protein
VRVVALASDFPQLLDASFNQIRQAASGNAAVLIQMCKLIGQLALSVEAPEAREALTAHLDKLERSAGRSLEDPSDLEDFEREAEIARAHLVPRAAST